LLQREQKLQNSLKIHTAKNDDGFWHISLFFFVLYLSLAPRVGAKIFLMVLKPLNRVKNLFVLWIALNMP